MIRADRYPELDNDSANEDMNQFNEETMGTDHMNTSMPTGAAPNPMESEVPIHERKYFVEISGSVTDFHRNSNCAMTQISPVNAHIFAAEKTLGNEKGGNPEQVVIRSVDLESISSNFPISVGLRITGVPGNVYSTNGERFAHVVMPNTNYTGIPINLMNSESTWAAAQQFRTKYEGFNESNLRDHGIGDMKGEPFVFVDRRHPVMDMIQENEHLLQSDVRSAQVFDNRYIKVDRRVYNVCMTQLEKQLRVEVPNVDCTKFQVSLHKPNGKAWDNEDDFNTELAEEAEKQAIAANRYHCKVGLNMKFSHM